MPAPDAPEGPVEASALEALVKRLAQAGLPWTIGTCTGGYCAMVGYCGSGEQPFASPLLALRAAADEAYGFCELVEESN